MTSGLRESKKAATRLALARAVLTLATRDGIDAVTIDAVAAEVGVSVRTFHNYFGGKADALIHFVSELLDRIVVGTQSRPADEPFWDSLRITMCDIITGDDGVDPAELATLLRMFDSEPALTTNSGRTELVDTAEERLTTLFADRGLDPDSLYPHLAFINALATSRAALEFWANRQDTLTATARDVLDAAFDQAAAGMTTPLPVQHTKEK
ncbi:TetR family transcriptional regulator [Gordonia sinesedis]